MHIDAVVADANALLSAIVGKAALQFMRAGSPFGQTRYRNEFCAAPALDRVLTARFIFPVVRPVILDLLRQF
jgi:hypothetical protein